MSLTQRVKVGYQLVVGLGGSAKGLHSFRVRYNGMVVEGADTPLWFKSKEAARGCAEACVKHLRDHLRQGKVKVEAHSG